MMANEAHAKMKGSLTKWMKLKPWCIYPGTAGLNARTRSIGAEIVPTVKVENLEKKLSETLFKISSC